MQYVTNDGVTIDYDRLGEGEPVLFIHGWASSASTFSKQLSYLCDDFLLLAPDLRGHGRSAKVTRGGRISRLAMDLHELLEHEGLERVSLVGWSMGCSVIWNYIDLFGEGRINKLVFIDEIPFVLGTSSTMTDWSDAELDVRPLTNLYKRFIPESTRETESANFISSMLKTASPSEREEVIATAKLASSFSAVNMIINNNVTDWRDLFKHIKSPTLLVSGSASFFRPEFYEWMGQQISDCRIVTKEGAGHFLHLEEAEWLNPILLDFLGG